MFTKIANFTRKVLKKDDKKPSLDHQVLSRDQHSISRSAISDPALKVLYRLRKAGFEAYLVGGAVRDLLLGKQPKDFDIVTNARPEQVRSLFRNCRLVGRRFRLAHILFGEEVIEVATFRGHHSTGDSKNAKQNDDGMVLRDNVYGTMDEDAERRDFSINALYYNIADFSVHAYAHGLTDLDGRTLRIIGDAETRYREDPVRMLRAVRFSAKLDLQIEASTAEPIRRLSDLLSAIPPARLFEEVIKLLLAGQARITFKLLRDYQLLAPLFPALDKLLDTDNPAAKRFVDALLRNTDERVSHGQNVTPVFFYAAILWPLIEERAAAIAGDSGLPYQDALQLAASDVLDAQQNSTCIPKRLVAAMREIWGLQARLSNRNGRRAAKLVQHPRFRAAYDFLLLRGEAYGGRVQELARWWHDYVSQDPHGREQLQRETQDNDTPHSDKPKAKRRRPRRNHRKPQRHDH